MSILSIFSTRKKYDSIKSLPISIWWSITEGGSFESLVISGKYSKLELYKTYLDLLQEYYDNFGTTETHEAFIKARYEYALKLAKYVHTQNGFDKTLLKMALIDLKELTPRQDQNGNKQTLPEAIAIIEENFGFPVDQDKLSVLKFYSYQKRITDKIQAQKIK